LMAAVLIFSTQSNENARLAQQNEQIAATAQADSKVAQQRQREAEARSLAAQALRLSTDDRPLALLLANEAAQRTSRVDGSVTVEAESALHTLLGAPDATLVKAVKAHNSHAWSVALRPDGTQYATVGCDERLASGLCRAGQIRLWDRQGNLLVEFGNRPVDISAISYSPDGSRLLTADDKGVVQLWDASGHEITTLPGYTGTLRSVAFSPDGQRILTLGETQPARLWDAAGKLIAVLDEKAARTHSALFSADSDRIVTAHCRTAIADGTCTAGYASLWDANGRPLATFAEGAGVNWAAFDPDGSRIITAECATIVESRCAEGKVRLWDAAGQPLETLSGPSFRNPVLFASFNEAGTRILAHSRTEAMLWKGNGEFLRQLDVAVASFWHVRFSPDGLLIITTGTLLGPTTANILSTDVRLWDADGSPLATLPGHEGVVDAAAFTPDHSSLLTAGLDGVVQIWDTRYATGDLERQLPGHKGILYGVVYGPAGNRLITVAEDGVRLWDQNGTLLAHRESRAQQVYAARFNRESTLFATQTCDVLNTTYDCQKGAMRLWDADGNPVREVAGYRLPGGYDFAPASGRMVIASEGNTARLLDATGETIKILTGHTGPINRITYNQDGTRFATASDDGTARVWDADGNFLFALTGHTGPVRGARFNSAGTHIITYGDDGSLRLWDAEGKPLQVMGGHPGGIQYAAFNPEGTLISVESKQGPARVWDLNGQLVAVIGENAVSIDATTFDPTGQRILAVECNELNPGRWCIRHSANLWTAHGNRLYTVDNHWIEWAAVRPDGNQIATAGCDTFDTLTGTNCENGGVWLWRAYPNVEAMLTEAQRRAGRTLTPAECQQYLGQEQCP
jgi:WD40 repeat protein